MELLARADSIDVPQFMSFRAQHPDKNDVIVTIEMYAGVIRLVLNQKDQPLDQHHLKTFLQDSRLHLKGYENMAIIDQVSIVAPTGVIDAPNSDHNAIGVENPVVEIKRVNFGEDDVDKPDWHDVLVLTMDVSTSNIELRLVAYHVTLRVRVVDANEARGDDFDIDDGSIAPH